MIDAKQLLLAQEKASVSFHLDLAQQQKLKANRDYRNILAFSRKCLMNIAGAGKFSSDRAVREVCR